uniref:Uncharacterized protein n=2 Tax=Calcidiscus leptoporus TaxID=127549 RepID=A0A7S0NR24_9EUKA
MRDEPMGLFMKASPFGDALGCTAAPRTCAAHAPAAFNLPLACRYPEPHSGRSRSSNLPSPGRIVSAGYGPQPGMGGPQAPQMGAPQMGGAAAARPPTDMFAALDPFGGKAPSRQP